MCPDPNEIFQSSRGSSFFGREQNVYHWVYGMKQKSRSRSLKRQTHLMVYAAPSPTPSRLFFINIIHFNNIERKCKFCVLVTCFAVKRSNAEVNSLKFKPLQNFMLFFVMYKIQINPLKNEGASLVRRSSINSLGNQRDVTLALMVESDWTRTHAYLCQMQVVVRSKMKETYWSQRHWQVFQQTNGRKPNITRWIWLVPVLGICIICTAQKKNQNFK